MTILVRNLNKYQYTHKRNFRQVLGAFMTAWSALTPSVQSKGRRQNVLDARPCNPKNGLWIFIATLQDQNICMAPDQAGATVRAETVFPCALRQS